MATTPQQSLINEIVQLRLHLGKGIFPSCVQIYTTLLEYRYVYASLLRTEVDKPRAVHLDDRLALINDLLALYEEPARAAGLPVTVGGLIFCAGGEK